MANKKKGIRLIKKGVIASKKGDTEMVGSRL